MNNESDENAANFKELMVELGLMQHVTRPTHKSGNILDLIFTEIFFLKLISTAAYWVTYYQMYQMQNIIKMLRNMLLRHHLL